MANANKYTSGMPALGSVMNSKIQSRFRLNRDKFITNFLVSRNLLLNILDYFTQFHVNIVRKAHYSISKTSCIFFTLFLFDAL